MISRRTLLYAIATSTVSTPAFLRAAVADTGLDTAWINARIWTGSGALPVSGAIGAKNGRFSALGTEAVKAACSKTTRIVDLDGAFVVPGFIDNHTHFVPGSLALERVDLMQAGTPAMLANAVGMAAARAPANRWILGWGWDAERWGGALPDRSLLDAVVPDRPVALRRTDGHVMLVNTVALHLAGIDHATPDPDGGVIVRDASGNPTGILKDLAVDLVERVIPPPDEREIDRAVGRGIALALSKGITQVHGTDLDWAGFDAFRRLSANGEPDLRYYSLTPIEDWEKLSQIVETEGRGDDWVRWGGVKGLLDGSLGARTALFSAPYTDNPTTRGITRLPPEQLQILVDAADRAGLQVACHAIGDDAVSILLDIFAQTAARNGPRDRRFRVEHAQHVASDCIPRFHTQGVIASMQPYHAADDGRWALKPLGKERLSDAWPIRSMLDRGARVTFGSDWPVAPLDPLAGLAAAVFRQTIDGKQPGGFVPEQRIRLTEALTAYTEANAYAGFQEDRLGMIAAGRLADFTVLDRDLFRNHAEDFARTTVLRTVVNGRERFAV